MLLLKRLLFLIIVQKHNFVLVSLKSLTLKPLSSIGANVSITQFSLILRNESIILLNCLYAKLHGLSNMQQLYVQCNWYFTSSIWLYALKTLLWAWIAWRSLYHFLLYDLILLMRNIYNNFECTWISQYKNHIAEMGCQFILWYTIKILWIRKWY